MTRAVQKQLQALTQLLADVLGELAEEQEEAKAKCDRVYKLKRAGVISDDAQTAILYPSLKSVDEVIEEHKKSEVPVK
jgi:hypothetical protein